MGNEERATGSREQRGGHSGGVTDPGQRHAPWAPRAEPHPPEPAAQVWPFCRRSREIREDLLEINPCLFNAHTRARARAAAVKKRASLWRGILSVLRKMYSNSTPCDWKVYSETCLQSPPAPPASQSPRLPAPPCSLSRRLRRETALRFQIRKGRGEKKMDSGPREARRVQGGYGWPRPARLRAAGGRVQVWVCKARSLLSLSSKRLHEPSCSLFPLLILRDVAFVNAPPGRGALLS